MYTPKNKIKINDWNWLIIIHKPIGYDKVKAEETTAAELDRLTTDCVPMTRRFTVSETPILLHSVLSSDNS